MTTSSSTIEPLIAFAASGLGIACVPDFAVKQLVAEGSLVVVLQKYMDQGGTFRAVWPSSPYLSPKLRVFVDYLAAHLLPASG